MEDHVPDRKRLDVGTRLLHLLLVISGLLAWITGGLAEDYQHARHAGFTIHGWIGIGAAAATALRLVYGVLGPRAPRFWNWLPVTGGRLRLVVEDVRGLLRLQLPDREPRQGLAAVVESFGLAVFAFLSATGVILFLYLEPGMKARGAMHLVKELHEAGEALLPLFVGTHAGAVVLHALTGRHLWRSMFFLKER